MPHLSLFHSLSPSLSKRQITKNVSIKRRKVHFSFLKGDMGFLFLSALRVGANRREYGYVTVPFAF